LRFQTNSIISANTHKLGTKKITSSDAEQIVVAIFEILDKFIYEVKIEDGITSVIIKMQD
jgi:hypothetical protein